MHNAPLWGALCPLLIFIPYIGVATMTAKLFLGAITTFDSVSRILATPGMFRAIDVVQASFVTPHVLARRMELNPVGACVSILLWGEIWGGPDSFMAVPIAVTLKKFCELIFFFKWVGELRGLHSFPTRRSAY